MPENAVRRFSWWVAERDAARPLIARGGPQTWENLTFVPDDVPDPHGYGYPCHPLAAEMGRERRDEHRRLGAAAHGIWDRGGLAYTG